MSAQQRIFVTNELVREICTEACESKGQCGVCKLNLLKNSIKRFEEGHTIKGAVKEAMILEERTLFDMNLKHDRKYDTYIEGILA